MSKKKRRKMVNKGKNDRGKKETNERIEMKSTKEDKRVQKRTKDHEISE